MAFTAQLDGVERTGNPATLTIHVTYRDDTNPDWTQPRDILVSLAGLTTAQALQDAIIAAVRADASGYFKQLQAHALVGGLVGQTITITA